MGIYYHLKSWRVHKGLETICRFRYGAEMFLFQYNSMQSAISSTPTIQTPTKHQIHYYN